MYQVVQSCFPTIELQVRDSIFWEFIYVLHFLLSTFYSLFYICSLKLLVETDALLYSCDEGKPQRIGPYTFFHIIDQTKVHGTSTTKWNSLFYFKVDHPEVEERLEMREFYPALHAFCWINHSVDD